MAPKLFTETVAVSVARHGADFTLIAGPDIIGRDGFQAALYSGTDPETLKPRQFLYVADTDHGGTTLEESYLWKAEITPSDEGYYIRKPGLKVYNSLGTLVVAYPR